MLPLWLLSGCGPLCVLSLGFHPGDWQRLMAQRRLPFRRTSFLPRQKGGKERPGASPWTPENGQRTPAWGGCSNPPPCLSWAVRSTVVCAERFLVRPLGMGSGGGACAGNLVFCSYLCPSGRFRPLLSWPYLVIFSAEKIEPFGLVACAQTSAAGRRPRRHSRRGDSPRRDLPIAPQG